jgi:hypothetical protein
LDKTKLLQQAIHETIKSKNEIIMNATASKSTGTFSNDRVYNDDPTSTTGANANAAPALISSANDDEYIDYSCSTSIERLARDIETTLHQWHVTNKCDRHVSNGSVIVTGTSSTCSTSSNSISTTTTGNKITKINTTGTCSTSTYHWQTDQQQEQHKTIDNMTSNKKGTVEITTPTSLKSKTSKSALLQQQSPTTNTKKILSSPPHPSNVSPQSGKSSIVTTSSSTYNNNTNTSSTNNNNPLLLRSQIINWNISFTVRTAANSNIDSSTIGSSNHLTTQQHQQRVSVTNVPLHLALWDSPPSTTTSALSPANKHKRRQSRTSLTSKLSKTAFTVGTNGAIEPKKQQQQHQKQQDQKKQNAKHKHRRRLLSDASMDIDDENSATDDVTTTSTTSTTASGAAAAASVLTSKFLKLPKKIFTKANKNKNNATAKNSRSKSQSDMITNKNNSYTNNFIDDFMSSSLSPSAWLDNHQKDYDSDDNDKMDVDDSTRNNTDADLNDCTTEDEEDDAQDNNADNLLLPYSLQQRRHSITDNKTYQCNDIFSNFSTLFGIGQHITLSPVDPDRALYIHDTEENNNESEIIHQNSPHQKAVHTLSSDAKRGKKTSKRNVLSQRTPSMLYEYLSHSIMHRHYGTIPNTTQQAGISTIVNSSINKGATNNYDTTSTSSSTFSTYVSTTLSSWLQTSLNLASGTCQCYFPLFGLWCIYEPSISFNLPLSSSNTSKSFQSWIKNDNNIRMTQSANNYSQQLLSRYRNTVQRSRQTTAISLSSPPKHQRTRLENNNIIHNNKRQRHPKHQSSITSSMAVIPASMVQASDYALMFNLIVPILTGTLQSEQCSSTFWLYSLTSSDVTYQYNLYRNGFQRHGNHVTIGTNSGRGINKTETISKTPNWTFWGTLLQQYCLHHEQQNQQKQYQQMLRRRSIAPQELPSTSDNDTLNDFVNLWIARHTFIWHKSLTPKSGLQRLLWLSTKTSDTEWRPNPMSTPYPHDVEMTTGSVSSSLNENISTHSRSSGHLHYHNDNKANNYNNRQERRFTAYRKHCRQVALYRIDKAAGSTRSSPLWGPPDDPILSMSATLSWENRSNNNISIKSNNDLSTARPLLALPLKSRHSMTESDWIEMEDATESAILDIHRPTTCTITVQFDHETPHASAAATQRCLLAALIRTATLPKETLLSHTIDVDLMSKSDTIAGNKIAGMLARKVGVNKTTAALVSAMDWATVVDEMIDDDNAESIIESVLSMSTTVKDNTNDVDDDSSSIFGNTPISSSYLLHTFPNPPEGFASNLVAMSSISSVTDNYNCHSRVDEKRRNSLAIEQIWQPLTKGAPPGRLLSLLFVQMARVRTPCSMALVWMTFCKDLRRRWDDRELLPNTNYVPGLDPLPSEYRNPNKINSLGGTTTAQPNTISTGGHANFAALVNSTEPDPDDMNCLIGQKLQVR